MSILDIVRHGGNLRERSAGRAPLAGRPFLLGALLVLLNTVAIGGQAAWFHQHLTTHPTGADWIPALAVAVVVEMIGVYLAGMAHAALMADQSAGLLRLGSYAVGVLVGTLNYLHFAEHDNGPNVPAVTFGLLSTISPWLWAIYSRYLHRDQLAKLGLVDTRGVKLSTNRKFWHPIKSIKVMSFAAWEGITNPDDAVSDWEASRQETRKPRQEKQEDPPEDQEKPSNAPVSPGAAPAQPMTTAQKWALVETIRDTEPGITKAAVAKQLKVTERTITNWMPEGARW